LLSHRWALLEEDEPMDEHMDELLEENMDELMDGHTGD